MNKSSHLAREIVETLALTLIIFVVIHFTIQNYQVDGTSMESSLHNNQYVLVNKQAYLFQPPARGDVIVFVFPLDTTKDLIKRVIGLPGDIIVTTSSTVQVDGVVLQEPYVKVPFNQEARQWTVPSNDYFVMGDNRQFSDDSRYWGFVPKSYIIGKAVMIYWPISNWQLINTYSAVFINIKPNH